MNACTDPVVGDILSSWRFDISGVAPAMRGDYEHHLAECSFCHRRQSLHRTIDVTLISLSTVSTAAFLLALAIIHHIDPLQHWAIARFHLFADIDVVLTMQFAAVAGLLASLLIWLIVALMTPAPMYLRGVAMERARVLHDRIPEHLRERLPRNVA
jgi:Zn-dependent protease